MAFGGSSFRFASNGGVVVANQGSTTPTSSKGDRVTGIIDTLAGTAVSIFNTVKQSDLLRDQIRAGQVPSIVADQRGRPSGEQAKDLIGVNVGAGGFGISGGTLLVIGAVVVLIMLVKK